MDTALDGIKVLDLSRLAPGPYGSMLLADLGADVVMVEAAGGMGKASRLNLFGDPERQTAFDPLLRNKRSVGLNLKNDRGRDLFYRLADAADVVLEGFRPGVVKRLGIDYDTLAARNERLVYCSISGYGQTGPYAHRSGHDLNYIGVGGALAITGQAGGKPAIPLNLIADFAAGGLNAAFAICAALLHRERSGRGQYVDISMSDGVLSLMSAAVGIALTTGAPIHRGEFVLNGGAPWYDVYPTADGKWISIGAIEPAFYQSLCEVLNCQHWLGDQFDAAKFGAMAEHYRTQIAMKTRDEWDAIFADADVPAGPVLEMDELADSPQHLARDMFATLRHDQFGDVRQVGHGAKFSRTPAHVRTTGPTVGQHTDEVLAGLGLDAGAIAELRKAGAVG
jgi:crotonobetainyl-CoA:carnitine CoA-transferase CaiB-like acyl-CoA transferase